MSTMQQQPQDYSADAPVGSRLRATVGSTRIEEDIFGRAFDGRIMSRLWAFVAPYRSRVIVAVIAVLIFTATQLAIPLIIRYAVDYGIAPARDSGLDMSHLGRAVALFVAVVIANAIANLIQERVVGDLAENVLFDIRRAMFGHLQRVSLSFMDKTEVGRLMSRLQGDVNSMQEFLETSVMAVGDFALLIGIVVAMLWLDVQLGLLVLSVLPILFIVRIFWIKKARDAFMAAHQSNSIANGALAEAIHGVRAVQSMGREELNLGLYSRLADRVLSTHIHAARLAQIMVPIVDTLTGIAMALVILVGGSMVVSGRLEIGGIIAFLFYIQRFFDPIRSLTLQYSVMQRAMASGHRLIEVLDVPKAITDKPDAEPLTEADDGSVEFRNVVFGYNPDEPVLRDVSFRVNTGETVALVGPTGSGKSSAMALVHRFYDVQDGAVLVGGRDVRDVTQDSLGHHIAMVLQEPYLFTGTVIENIRYSTEHASVDQVIEASKAVGAHDFIMRLPEGYDTLLDERGGNLSQGQRQLLSFARALVADAPILILDEATANIDSYTEMQIQKALQRLLEGRTGLIIAHRLATIRGADRIIVLQKGSVIESGNHDALMARDGLYAGLYNLNHGSFDDLGTPSDPNLAS
ncbi:ABC transporter ATP-binding protein [Marinibacterium profundimaris]|uniref:Multidrug ABC transporter n=1 Tax=Marinibacterium profundimaris TaxID=1679460 RepID=A0A225NG44_9RHOB|nr:ABC transporter ATP-binding protein [Marinibacterium profundimaris]OWU68119.1 multidrug ABC transporter [Marinibacterium profundimaris]